MTTENIKLARWDFSQMQNNEFEASAERLIQSYITPTEKGSGMIRLVHLAKMIHEAVKDINRTDALANELEELESLMTPYLDLLMKLAKDRCLDILEDIRGTWARRDK